MLKEKRIRLTKQNKNLTGQVEELQKKLTTYDVLIDYLFTEKNDFLTQLHDAHWIQLAKNRESKRLNQAIEQLKKHSEEFLASRDLGLIPRQEYGLIQSNGRTYQVYSWTKEYPEFGPVIYFEGLAEN